MNKITLCVILLNSFLCFSQNATVIVNPDDSRQEVIFGGDGKLTINDWANGNTSTIATKLFVDMDLRVLRVPIFALHPINHQIYDQVVDVIQSVKAKDPNIKIFASVANGDGYGVNHHGAAKFAASMKGCCPYNVYSLNLTAYAAYLDSFMQLMSDNGIMVDYLGPFNEDPGDDSDYRKIFDQMTKLGNTKKVGMESYALQTAINNVNDVEDRLDVVGAHFYDDVNINSNNWEPKWNQLVNKSADPVWYSEATRYSTGNTIDLLLAGLNNVFPAINGGADVVVFYQVVKRFVGTNGNPLTKKYTGFQKLVNSANFGNVVGTTVTGNDVSSTSFFNGTTLNVHITNTSTSNKTTRIELQSGYKVYGQVSRFVWTATSNGASNSYSLNGNSAWNITVPSKSFVSLRIPVNTSSSSQFRASSDIRKTNVGIWPNPFENHINFGTDEGAFELFTLSGRKLDVSAERTNTGFYIKTEELDSGIYILKSGNVSNKMVKM